MVGRLVVEHQEVRRVEQHAREHQARVFSPPESARTFFSTSSPEN